MALLTGLTIDDFEQLPDAVARNHELVKGALVDVSGNAGGHNLLRDVLVEVLRPYIRQQKLGLVVAEQEFDKFEALHEKALYYRAREVKEVYIFSIQTRMVFRYSEGSPAILTEDQEFRPDQIPGFSIIRIVDLLAMI